MNYRLSCAVDRPANKEGFVLECDGREITSDVSKCVSSNMKVCIFDALHKGILSARVHVKHDDLLHIEVQNYHVYEWLSCLKEYNGYSEELDKVFSALESVDCKYKIIFLKNLYGKTYLKNHDYTKVKVSSLESVMEEFK